MGSLTSQVLGNLTSDIELKTTTKGMMFAPFTIAVNHDKDTVSFVRCASWGKTAEVITKHFKKGDQIFVSGTAKVDKEYGFEVQVNNFSFVSSKRDNRPLTQNEVLEKSGDFVPTAADIDDKPIDLSEIPFS